jgi:UDP-N-acetylglucosamine 4,6-dehydratase
MFLWYIVIKLLNTEVTMLNKKWLIVGGTGSFGQEIIKQIFEKYEPKKIYVYSRDEYKQHLMNNKFKKDPSELQFFIGDVRDLERLKMATDGIDCIIHTAALKHVPSCEYNPFEAIKTNVLGSQNVIQAALYNNVKKVIALSTDKAVNPMNLYGATKLCMEKLIIGGNAYVGDKNIKFSICRYGNVIGSRGSVVQTFKKQKRVGTISITNPEMTRFWISLKNAAEFVLNSLDIMQGGEIFIPKLPSMKITDLAECIAPDAKINIIGVRPGEKIHEMLIAKDDRILMEAENFYIIENNYHWNNKGPYDYDCEEIENFDYTSDTNDKWLTVEEMRGLLNDIL